MPAASLAKISTSDLIPSGFFDELIFWRDQLSEGAWHIGKICNQIYVLAVANDLEVTKLELYDRIGTIIGKSGRAIRYYAETAAFYTDIDRQKYNVLPFSHFATARRFPEWRGVLDKSLEYMDNRGMPPAADRLESLYFGETSHNKLPEPPPSDPGPQGEPEELSEPEILSRSELLSRLRLQLHGLEATLGDLQSKEVDGNLVKRLAKMIVELRETQEMFEYVEKGFSPGHYMITSHEPIDIDLQEA